MTDNGNPEAAWTYHDATKHSYTSIRTNPHFMDWSNQPLPFKIYPTLEPMPLPREVRQTGVAALSAISESVAAQTNAAPHLEAVAQLLYLSPRITRHRQRATQHHLYLHLLAQRVEISSPHLPSFWLGQRHSAGQPARRRHRVRVASPRGLWLR